MEKDKDKRIVEIDLLRVLAVILMIVYHVVYDLDEFMGLNVNYEWIGFAIIGKTSAFLFIFLAGVCSGLSERNLEKGIELMAIALILTLISYIFFRSEYIRFGILHLISTMIILAPFLREIRTLKLLILSVSIILTYFFFLNILSFNMSMLIPLGLYSRGFNSLDYYPVIPYGAIFIFGVILYKEVYYERESILNFDKEFSLIRLISQNSLGIYLVHQPVILSIMYLIKYIVKVF